MADMSQASLASSQATEGPSSAQVKNTTPVYEIGFHVVPTVGDEGVAAVVEAIRKALGAAEIISENFPHKITLAYQVDLPAGRQGVSAGKREKYTESYFGFIKFALMRDAISAFKEAVAVMPNVLRYIIVETTREDVTQQKQRAVFTSDRLEGKTLEKPAAVVEKSIEVSEAELDKSIEALTG